MTTPMNEEMQRIRAYLQGQAAKLTVPELADKVRNDMEQVKAAIDSLPDGALDRRPAEGEWCANEVLAHLTATSAEVHRGIVSAIEGSGRPERIADRIQPAAESLSGDEWWQRLLADREALLTRVRAARGDENLDVQWNHPMFGDLNWREWLLFLRIHDLDHTRQLQAMVGTAGEG